MRPLPGEGPHAGDLGRGRGAAARAVPPDQSRAGGRSGAATHCGDSSRDRRRGPDRCYGRPREAARSAQSFGWRCRPVHPADARGTASVVIPGGRPGRSWRASPSGPAGALTAARGPAGRAEGGEREQEDAASVQRHVGHLGQLVPVHPRGRRAHAALRSRLRPYPARSRVPGTAGHQGQSIPRPAQQRAGGGHGDLAGHGPAHLPDRLGRTTHQLLIGRNPHRYRSPVHRAARPVAHPVRSRQPPAGQAW